MGIELHILGTSSARPTSKRQVSGSLVQCEDGIAVIDAGEGFQTRYAAQRKRLKLFDKGTSLRAARVHVVCLTHGHLDHTWGLLPWMHTMSLDKREVPLLVLGPTSPEAFDSLCAGTGVPDSSTSAELARQITGWQSLGGTSAELGYSVRWVLGDVVNDRWMELNDDGSTSLLSSMPQPEGWKRNKLHPLPSNHSVPSCSWMLESKGSLGKFNRLMSTELRLSDEEKLRLSSGEDIKRVDGSLLKATDFRGEDRPGTRLIVSGDTSEMAESLSTVGGVDVLVHEATFMDDAQQWADQFQHSTSTGAARTALAAKAKHLVLTHFSARINDANLPVAEAKGVLAESGIQVTAAMDGDRIHISNSGSITHRFWAENGWKA
ncbi:MAG: hypothetical protein CMA63_00330 [Euryarchaeota archaeon]|nr:hypothetical protein [Euryarchaeota archaeon]